MYLSMLPFAFLLFLLWIWQGKEPTRLSLKSPLCFIFLLVLHPIYIFWVVRKWWVEVLKEATAEVEVRRRKRNLFAWLSKEERAFVERFAKSNLSFSEMRIQAEAFGQRKHYLFIAIVAVIAVSISHRLIAAYSHEVPSPSVETVTVDHSTVTTVDADVGCDVSYSDSHLLYGVFTEPPWDPLILRIHLWIRQLRFKLSNGYERLLDPIPLYC